MKINSVLFFLKLATGYVQYGKVQGENERGYFNPRVGFFYSCMRAVFEFHNFSFVVGDFPNFPLKLSLSIIFS